MKIFAVNLSDLDHSNVNDHLYSRIVSNDTLNRARKFRNRKDTLRTMVGELLINYLYEKVEGYGTIPVIRRNQYGKPYVTSNNFLFNLSHSGNWVICIVDQTRVGIDIEQIKAIDYENLISMFHPVEMEQMEYAENKQDFFYSLWTVKESVLKNIGKGLSLSLKSFHTKFSNEDIQVKFENPLSENLYVKTYDFDYRYKLAACALHNDFPNHITYINIAKIIQYYANFAPRKYC
ncbi:4'-phosphopantetheinyl transferase superfamily protein [Bacillus spongiae]|uniref:4'-phosphopantetheinyl transferase superfamily protein n=1 Tax=Bacillus spongiae TaxID=2683610 RepID=A0ABU8HHT5_9BACI